MNNLNPVFQKSLKFHYTSVDQELKFTMWDHDGGSDFELIGSVEFMVQELLEDCAVEGENSEFQEQAVPLEKELKHPEKPDDNRRGKIRIHVTKSAA